MCSTVPEGSHCLYEKEFIGWDGIVQERDAPVFKRGLPRVLPKDFHSKCIFHSEDIDWKRDNYFADYLSNYLLLAMHDKNNTSIEFDSIQFTSNTGQPMIDLSKFNIVKNIKFKNAKFFDSLDFRNTVFNESVDFFLCRFHEDTYFKECKAHKSFVMNNCVFFKRAYFNYFHFSPVGNEFYPSFNESVFKGQANFPNCYFKNDLNFQLITFEDKVYFTNSVFDSRCLFQGTRFEKECDFSNAKFLKEVFFTIRDDIKRNRVEFFNSVTFSSAKIQGAIRFDDAILAEANFDNITIGTTGRLYFKGTILNKMFTQSVSFNVDDNKLLGFISFENIKVAHIHDANFQFLQQLSEGDKPKVYFREGCEFFINSADFFYDFDNSSLVTMEVLKKTFECLKEWLYAFTINSNLILILNDTRIQHKQFGVTLRWERTEDLKLYKALGSYFFECIQIDQRDKNISNFIKRLDDYSFLENFVHSHLIDRRSLKSNLEGIIVDFHHFFYRKSSSAKYIVGYHNGKEMVVKPTKETASSDESILNLSQLDRNILKILKEILDKITEIQMKCGVIDDTQNHPFTNFNQIIIDMSTKIENIKIEGVSQSPITIGSNIHDINVSYHHEVQNMNYEKLSEELSLLMQQLRKDAKTPDDYVAISQVAFAENACKDKDGNKVIQFLKKSGQWVFDTATKIGVIAVAEIIKRHM